MQFSEIINDTVIDLLNMKLIQVEGERPLSQLHPFDAKSPLFLSNFTVFLHLQSQF